MALLHDFVYLSDRKLATLVVDRPAFRRRILNIKGEVRAPFVSFSIEADGSPGVQARGAQSTPINPSAIDRIIDEISTRSLWYSDEAARTGDWIFFETPMNYSILEGRYFNSSVIFVDHRDLLSDTSVRILLHGSTEHLMDRPRPVDIDSDVERLNSSPSSGAFVYSLADNVADVVRTINSATSPFIAFPHTSPRGSLAAGLIRILRALDRKFAIDTAAWLAGLARVTASVGVEGKLGNVERIVMATPLYVEYADSRNRD